MFPNAKTENGVSDFTIEWSDLRQVVENSLLKNSYEGIKREANRSEIRKNTHIGSGGWYGYNQTELTQWITKGFRTDNLGIEVVPPVREKRRYVYSEDAAEMHIDRVLSGEDNYAGEFTKRVIIPGVSILVETGFSSVVPARIVNAFNVFVCQCIQSLEASGVDCEISYEYKADRLWHSGNGTGSTKVRVKRQNESSDFGSFSPMISPATFRTFFFVANAIHADVKGIDVSSGQGNASRFRTKWDVTQDEKTGQIIFNCPWNPDDFPKSLMETKFQQVLRISN